MAYTDVENIQSGFLVTSEWLREEKACKQQVTRFRNVYPKGLKITTRNLNTARSTYRLNTRWLIETILDWNEWTRLLYKYTGANPRIWKWEKKNARLFHSAFVRILKERG